MKVYAIDDHLKHVVDYEQAGACAYLFAAAYNRYAWDVVPTKHLLSGFECAVARG